MSTKFYNQFQQTIKFICIYLLFFYFCKISFNSTFKSFRFLVFLLLILLKKHFLLLFGLFYKLLKSKYIWKTFSILVVLFPDKNIFSLLIFEVFAVEWLVDLFFTKQYSFLSLLFSLLFKNLMELNYI